MTQRDWYLVVMGMLSMMVAAVVVLGGVAIYMALRPAPRLHLYDEHGTDLVYYCPGDARCNPTPWPSSR